MSVKDSAPDQRCAPDPVGDNGLMATELWITGDPDTDKLLSDDPFALLVGMLLDHSIR